MSNAFPADERQPISFPTWNDAVASLPAVQRADVVSGVLDFLRYCKGLRAPVSVALVKRYLAEGGDAREAARPALRWFCSGGRVKPDLAVASPPAIPPRRDPMPGVMVRRSAPRRPRGRIRAARNGSGI